MRKRRESARLTSREKREREAFDLNGIGLKICFLSKMLHLSMAISRLAEHLFFKPLMVRTRDVIRNIQCTFTKTSVILKQTFKGLNVVQFTFLVIKDAQ